MNKLINLLYPVEIEKYILIIPVCYVHTTAKFLLIYYLMAMFLLLPSLHRVYTHSTQCCVRVCEKKKKVSRIFANNANERTALRFGRLCLATVKWL